MLIGLTGPAGCGKDTAGEILADILKGQTYSFARPMRDALQAMFGISDNLLADRKFKEAPLSDIGASPRRLMQTLGTEWGRDLICPDLWVLLGARAYRAWAKSTLDRPFIVTDVRFDNEAAWIHREGGVVLKLVPLDPPVPVQAHRSEDGISPEYVSATIYNPMTRIGLAGELLTALANIYPEAGKRVGLRA